MTDFISTDSEAGFIQEVRDIFRAYVPESDAWAKPNFFDINATVIGGIAWSAVNEARRGFDLRANLQTAHGQYLDLLASQPPLNLFRLGATSSNGSIIVSGWPSALIPGGTVFESAAGIKYKALADVVNVAGQPTTVAVASVLAGDMVNSQAGQPLQSGDATAVSLGIFGGFGEETDYQFRNRIYAEKTKYCFFGSAESYQRLLLGYRGITRVWALQDGGVATIAFLMEDTYQCGVPLQSDIDAVQEYLSDPCLTPLYFCPNIQPACAKSINPVVNWTIEPDDLCDVQESMTQWMRATYDLGDGVAGCEIQAWLSANYPDNGPSIDACINYDSVPCCVYNCAILEGCDTGGEVAQLSDFSVFVGVGQTSTASIFDTNNLSALPPGILSILSVAGLPSFLQITLDLNGSITVFNNWVNPGGFGGIDFLSFTLPVQYQAGDFIGTASFNIGYVIGGFG